MRGPDTGCRITVHQALSTERGQALQTLASNGIRKGNTSVKEAHPSRYIYVDL